MTDRDHFAAAALTGLLSRPAWFPHECAPEAYRIADAMLRERGNQPEPPDSSPVTEPMPKEKRAEVSDGKPVAWAVMDGHEFMEFCTDKEEAKCAAKYYGGRIVPLYRNPKPTLTDAEREAVDTAEASLMRESTDRNTPEPVRQRFAAAVNTLRRLLDRTK